MTPTEEKLERFFRSFHSIAVDCHQGDYFFGACELDRDTFRPPRVPAKPKVKIINLTELARWIDAGCP